MVETITPVVHGDARKGYWWTVALHAAGAALAAGLLGALLGGLGALLGAPRGSMDLLVVGVVAGAYASRELFGVPVPLPDKRRQVPDWWRTFFSPPMAAFLYGAGLGVGFVTFLSYGTFVAVAVGAVATGDPLVGALVGAPFGAARGLAVAIGSGSEDADQAGRVVDRLEAIAAGGAPRMVNGLALVAIALLAAMAA